jgi:Arc/MetJ-type ribon-helix-helix transcriptional regulator
MTRVEKVTVSIPAELLSRIEQHRAALGRSRSEVVADLLWRGWRELEFDEREARYREAYRALPDTAEELEWADLAAGDLPVPEERSPGAAPEPRKRKRRAAG